MTSLAVIGHEDGRRIRAPILPRGVKCVGAMLALLTAGQAGRADERVVLRDGMEFVGQVQVEENRIAVRSGPRVVYLGPRQLLHPEAATDVEHAVRFLLPQPPSRRGPIVSPGSGILRATPFDAYGRRTITLLDAKRREVNVIQGITELYPTHAVLRATSLPWQSTIAVGQIPSEQLVPILRKAVDPEKGLEALRIVGFLLQAGRFEEARQELAAVRAKFTDLEEACQKLAEKIDRGIAERAFLVLHRALDAGQTSKAKQIVTLLQRHPLPETLAPKVEAVAKQLAEYERSLDQLRLQLGQVAESASTETREPLQPAVDEIVASLSLATRGRLLPMVQLADEASTSPDEALALAVSGWVLGADLAQKDRDHAVRVWKQREALRAALLAPDEVTFQDRFAKLESLGAKPDGVLRMIDYLPAPAPTGAPGVPIHVKSPTRDLPDHEYWVMLPPQYDRFAVYPAIVALHGLNGTPERELNFWKSFAADHGTIVVAPRYREEESKPYKYSLVEHDAYQTVIRDIRRRFAVDADRVFLSGHDLGGMAAWDLGMAHPDDLAGLIPFTGPPMFYCDHYWPNLERVAVYAVEGSANGDNPAVTQRQFQRYFSHGFDALYFEYPGAGRESFSGELPTLFDWMSRKRRTPLPAEFRAVAARASDRRFYWIEIDAFLNQALVAPELFHQSKVRPAKIEAKSSNPNTLTVTTSGIESLTLKLSPGLVHLDAPDLTIRVQRRVVHKGPIEPDLETLVRTLRQTGDRKRPVVKEIRVPRV